MDVSPSHCKQLVVSGYPSAHIWDLRFGGGSLWLPCLFSLISRVHFYFSTETVFKIVFLRKIVQ